MSEEKDIESNDKKEESASRLPPGGNKAEEVFSEQLATLQSEISKASALI